MTLARLRRHPALLAVLAAGIVAAGCGETPQRQETAQAATTQPSQGTPLLHVWRNFEETGIPEEMTVYADGEVRYRNLLHTQAGIPVLTSHLPAERLARIRRALARVDLATVDASAVKPRRSGFRYVIRSDGEVATAADGHLSGPVKPLVREVRAKMDRLRHRSF